MGDWRFKDGFRPRGHVAASAVGAVVRELRDADGLTPSAYVDRARPKDSPVHDTLTWNDKEAATEYRLIEARRIIRAVEEVVTVSEGGGDPVRTVIENIHVPDRLGRGEGRYVGSDTVATEPDDYAAALAETRARFSSAWSAFRRLQRVTEGRDDPAAILSIAAAGFAEVDKALGLLA